MIYIKKSSEPGKLIEYRHQPGAKFDDMDSDVKEQLRTSLLKEQGHLCAYCMKRIEGTGDVKIEHWEARTAQNELQYSNLLAVCKGGEDGPSGARSCDTQKGNRPLFLNPLSKRDMDRIYYTNSGEVHSSDITEYQYEFIDHLGKIHKECTTPDQDLNQCLNLNYINGIPMSGRKTALKRFQEHIHPYKDAKSRDAFLQKMWEFYSKQDDYQEPYVGILRWYIQKKLK